MTTEINRRITRSMTIQPVSFQHLYVFKDDITGIEYITEEQIQMRCLSNNFYTKNNTLVVDLYLYDEISNIHPDYLKSCPEHVANREDLFALAPDGFIWKETDSETSYYDFDEWRILKRRNYNLKNI